MIIQSLLATGLALVWLYAFTQRRKSRFVSLSISAVATVGIVLVIRPELSNALAAVVGVGRGADLVMYAWIVVTLIICMNLQFKILSLQHDLTVIIRRLAIISAAPPPTTENSSEPRNSA